MEERTTSTAATSKSSEVTSNESPQPTIKKKQRMNGQKTCRICGDRALAHNFDVVSCESCKAFFRRNALKAKIKPCAFDGECDITRETRRFCCQCRLRKCLSAGMKPDMILDVGEKKARQDKLAENRMKRQQAEQRTTTGQHHDVAISGQYETVTSGLYEAVTSAQYNVDTSGHNEASPSSSLGTQWHRPTKAESDGSTAESGPEAVPVPPPCLVSSGSNRGLRGSKARSQQMEQAKRDMTLLDVSTMVPRSVGTSPAASRALEVDVSFQHVGHDQLPSDPHKYWHLKDEERALLGALTLAYQETVLKLPDSMCNMRPINVQNILDRCRRFSRDVVNFVKRVADFRTLRVQDQIAAVKGASWRTFLVKSAANFVVEMDAWIKDDGYLSVEQFTEAAPEHRDKILLLARYSSSLKNIIGSDPTAFAILQTMVLFDPRDPSLTDRQTVAEMADKYGVVLKHYLQSQWSYDYAGYYLSAVIDRLRDMPWVADSVQAMYMDWVDLVEPLMREVLNLN